jgi:heme/copper-type cytochrome/quinol oxidase subunit 3
MDAVSYDDRHDSMPAGLPYDVPGRAGAGVPQSGPPLPSGSPVPTPVRRGRPATVTLASVCLIADIAVFVVSFALVVIYQDDLVAATIRKLGDQTAQLPPDVVPGVIRVVLFTFAVIQLLISIVVAVLAILVLRRRRMPWIFTIVLSWVFVVAQLLSFISTADQTAPEIPAAANSLGQMLTGMGILLMGTAAVCLVLPATVGWFRRPRR